MKLASYRDVSAAMTLQDTRVPSEERSLFFPWLLVACYRGSQPMVHLARLRQTACPYVIYKDL
jgi:hypothetical protein